MGGPVIQLATGGYHTCALLEVGAVRCWGYNGAGQLGQGDQNIIGDNELPDSVDVVDVGGRAFEINASGDHTCALLDNNVNDANDVLRCWGYNEDGRLGYAHTRAIGDIEVPSEGDPVSYVPRVLGLTRRAPGASSSSSSAGSVKPGKARAPAALIYCRPCVFCFYSS